MRVAKEEELRTFSKQFKTIIPRREPISEADVQRLGDTLLWLLNAAEFPQLASSHRTAACNALCGFVDATSQSDLIQVRLVTLNQVTWNRLLSFYLDRYQDASTRSMKQVLSTVTNLIRTDQQYKNDGTSKWAEDVGSMCIRSISSYSDSSSLKPSMLLLENVLSKDLLPWYKFIELLSATRQETVPVSIMADPVSIHKRDSAFLALHQIVDDVLRWCKYADIATVAGKLLKTIFTSGKHEIGSITETGLNANTDEPIWLSPILRMAKDDFTNVEKLEKHILPQLLSIDEKNLMYLIRELPFRQLVSGNNGDIQEVDIKFSILLVTVMRAMKLSVSLINQIQLHTQVPFPELEEKLVSFCIQHQSPYVRVGALNLIITTDGIAQPFSENSLAQVQVVLNTLFVESDAGLRGDAINKLKRLADRLGFVVKKLKKSLEAGLQATNSSEIDITIKQRSLERHESFVSWLHSFLCEGLRPSASYQRHIMSLKTLGLASVLALFSICKIDLFSPTMIAQLVDLILDPFEDVRNFSAILLTCAEPLDDNLFDPVYEGSFISVARDRMITTGRASISDGYARLMELSYHRAECRTQQKSLQNHAAQVLLTEINEGLTAAQSNFIEAVKYPQLHGQFNALRYIIMNPRLVEFFATEEEWIAFKNELIKCCYKAWETVKSVLCMDSPEGHFDEEDIQDTDIGVKDTLSYSWRTLRESSALLQTMITTPNIRLLSLEESRLIGDLCFTQLAELRHRGAFSTVAQCFVSCCIRDGHTLNEEGISLAANWYERLLLLIDTKSATLTRRSAGLPDVITAILSAKAQGSFFDKVFTDLQSTAARNASPEHKHGKTGLPQVHAMNCLRSIFTNSRLAHIAERHLESTLQIAVQSLDHDIWSIRNCGGMLLKAVLIRLNSGIGISDQSGGHRNIAKTIYRKYASLATIVESLLSISVSFTGQANRQVNNGFPALAIVDQFGVQEDRKPVIRSLLLELLESPVWLIRERAAISIAQFTDSSTILETIHTVLRFSSGDSLLRINGLHGRLLSLKARLGQGLPENYHSLLFQLLEYSKIFTALTCHFISVIYFDILAMLFQGFWSNDPIPDRDVLKKHMQEHIEEFMIVLEEYMAREQIIHPSSQKLHVLMNMWCCNSKTDKQRFSSSININKNNAVFVAHFLTMQHEEALCNWDYWLSGLFDACTELIREDPESSLVLETTEQLVELLTKFHIIAYVKSKTSDANARTVLTKSTETLLSECEEYIHRGRTISRMALELFGALLMVVERGSESKIRCSRLIREIRCALDDEMDVSRRLSAIKALSCTRQVMRERLWSIDNRHMREVSILVGILFDGLVDDDDDVRNMTADVVSYITMMTTDATCSPPSLNSMVAQDILLQYIKTQGLCSTALFSDSLARLLDLGTLPYQTSMSEDTNTRADKEDSSKRPEHTSPLFLEEKANPLAQAIHRALAEDNTLFEIERQNLYKDNVQQMQIWAQILMSVHPEAHPSAVELLTFYQWAVSGLETIMQSSYPAGWAHRQEGFEAICRVLIFAKVVLSWRPMLNSLVRLKEVLAAVEVRLQPAHGEHITVINDIKLQLEQMT